MRFQKEDETVTFYKGPPQGPIGATLGTAMNKFYSSPNMVSTHYITWPFSFWIWRRRCLKFAWFWPFGALPLGPHGGHTYYLNNFESPTPKDDFCQVWLKSNHAFSRRRWKCKKFTDGRKRTAIAHRWAKNPPRGFLRFCVNEIPVRTDGQPGKHNASGALRVGGIIKSFTNVGLLFPILCTHLNPPGFS